MADVRPSIETALDAWGFDVTVTPPTGPAVATVAFWLPSTTPETPQAASFRRAEQQRVLVVPVGGLTAGLPRGSSIAAPEYDGAAPSDWTVDAVERVDFDAYRVRVVPA